MNLERGYKPLLRDKSPEERIAFYRAKAHGFQAAIAAHRQEQPANELQPA